MRFQDVTLVTNISHNNIVIACELSYNILNLFYHASFYVIVLQN